MKNITTVFLILFIYSAAPVLAQEKGFQGQEGSVIEQIKYAKNFDKIIMTGGGDLFISPSPVSKLKIVGKDSCLHSINTTVKSNILKIDNSGSSDCKTAIYIDMPVLKEIQQDGGGDIKVSEGFDTIGSFYCALNGGGSINMQTVEVDSFIAHINGGGTLSIHANKLLKADIKGGGLISYQGSPKVVSNILGGGSVKRQ